ncbi:hypothetical protein CYMTET_23662 [Cymbomonas tetramitiformis]|uniref:Uncharacterized protein n=1 Tax=Cymbomonas tetramitiformis TaxID=36881 RepID=A0AAE0FXQ8_9CHLO|nr:hypothetical protein CYMTET_23662 [Cymbomonas tetramitiformis]
MDDIDAEFPAPPDLSNPALNLVAYSVLCPARDLSLQEVQDLITDVSNRDLPHDADRRKLMFQTIIAWRETPDWKIHLPHGKFLVKDSPPGYYESIEAVFKKFAAKPLLMKQLHSTDTNSNESVNGMVVKGFLPCGKAQQNGQSGVYAWACCHTICSKNEGPAYRQELCSRLGLPTTDAMVRLDGRLGEKRKAARETRGTHKGKAARLRKRLHKADRNAGARVQATYETGGDLDKDCYGNVFTEVVDD